MKCINQMAENDEFVGFFLIKEMEIRKTNSTPSKDYMDIVLADSTGELPAKYWDVTSVDKEQFQSMIIVKVHGTVQKYRESTYKSKWLKSDRLIRKITL